MYRLCAPHALMKNSVVVFAQKRHAHRMPTVFQTNPPLNDVTIADVQDALVASMSLTPVQKKDYFYSQGIDYDNVFRYYTIVIMLMSIYKKKM